jgi:hypothetical protein
MCPVTHETDRIRGSLGVTMFLTDGVSEVYGSPGPVGELGGHAHLWVLLLPLVTARDVWQRE